MRMRVALAVVLSLALAPGFASADALDSWRDLARDPRGAELLAISRAALQAAAGDSVAPAAQASSPPKSWPAPPAALYLTLVGEIGTRACVGHDPPRGADVAEAVRALAPFALTGDRRRPPVRAHELAGLRIVLAFAAAPAPVRDPIAVDPAREALLIESPQGHVAFLPGEARTISWALHEARRIGVLAPGAAPRYSRFQVVTLSEPSLPSTQGRVSDETP